MVVDEAHIDFSEQESLHHQLVITQIWIVLQTMSKALISWNSIRDSNRTSRNHTLYDEGESSLQHK